MMRQFAECTCGDAIEAFSSFADEGDFMIRLFRVLHRHDGHLVTLGGDQWEDPAHRAETSFTVTPAEGTEPTPTTPYATAGAAAAPAMNPRRFTVQKYQIEARLSEVERIEGDFVKKDGTPTDHVDRVTELRSTVFRFDAADEAEAVHKGMRVARRRLGVDESPAAV